jgi:Cu+-exporting ATPase
LKKTDRAQALESVLQAIPGVRAAKINLGSGAALVEYDAPAVTIDVLSKAVKSAGYRVGGAQTRIGIADLHCASCVKFIEEGLKATPGVLDATVNVGTQEATIDYLPEKTSLPQLRSAIEEVGYQTRPAASDEPEDTLRERAEHEREYRRLMNKFWFAAAISIPVLIAAYPKFLPIIRDWPLETLRCLGRVALLTLPYCLLWRHFFSGAWAALKHRSANMNTLVAWARQRRGCIRPCDSVSSHFPEGTSEPFYDGSRSSLP